MKVNELKIGTTLKKGTRKRTFEGMEGHEVRYTVPSDATHYRLECIETFEKWMEKSEIL